MPRKIVGVVRGRSEGGPESMLKKIEEAQVEEQKELEQTSAKAVETPKAPKAPKVRKVQRKRRNHRLPIDYVVPLDNILADSYVKQKSAHEVIQSFVRRLESRGIEAPFEEERFKRAAGNMATVAMIKEIAWLFGLGPDHTDRVVEHTIDRLFGSPVKERK